MSGGSFENLIYDQGTYCVDLKQSTAPLKRMLDPTFANNCTSCRPADIGYIGKQGASVTHQMPLIDVESDMKLLTYRNTRDPMKKYRPCCPYCKNPSSEGYPCGGGVVACQECRGKMYHFPACSISTDYPRVTNPPCNLRGTGVNRFQPLCLDPQDLNRWEVPGEVGINYRMVALDNHVPCVPKLMNQNAVLPPKQEGGMHQGCSNPCDFLCASRLYASPLYHDYYAKPMRGCPDLTYV